ncbi:hypothetical protein M422DRAFT_244996 [Sphaerobolus stellatus SS14]|nr:hypothetical protein M422DRAFT_244996 [Sphaerobolus stellatus SS14]
MPVLLVLPDEILLACMKELWNVGRATESSGASQSIDRNDFRPPKSFLLVRSTCLTLARVSSPLFWRELDINSNYGPAELNWKQLGGGNRLAYLLDHLRYIGHVQVLCFAYASSTIPEEDCRELKLIEAFLDKADNLELIRLSEWTEERDLEGTPPDFRPEPFRPELSLASSTLWKRFRAGFTLSTFDDSCGRRVGGLVGDSGRLVEGICACSHSA